MVQNYMETLVDKALSTGLADYPEKYSDICQCPSCLAIIKAEALNLLKPFYVTTIAGEVFGEYASKETRNMAEVMVALGKGIEALKRTDPHGTGSGT